MTLPTAQPPSYTVEPLTKTILIVDDKLSLTRMLQDFLGSEGYRTVVADNGRNALYTARHAKPDLILLDLMMPEMDGFEFMETYRQEADVPVIMLTASSHKENALLGLELGADDYVTKPFDLEVLSARIAAVLRRYEKGQQAVRVLRAGELELDPELRRVRNASQEVSLTGAEYTLLHYLMAHPGRVFSRAELLKACQSNAKSGSERSVDVHMRNLRMKLEDNPKQPDHLETVFGAGYRFNRRRKDRS